jgi:spoIIIJ-associated protein
MDWITTSGNSIDEAKSNALDQLGIVADEAEFDIVNDVQKGFLGRVKTEAKIRARVKPKQPAAKEDRGGRRRGGGNGNGKGRGNGSRSRGNGGGNNRGGNKGGGNNRNQGNGGGNNRGGNKGGGNNRNQDTNGAQNAANDSSKAQNNNQNKSQKKEARPEKSGGQAAAAAATANEQKEKKGNVEHEFSREEQEKVAVDFLEGMLDVFDMDGQVAVAAEPADDDAIEMTVTGKELGLLVGPKGATLNALQELTRTVVQREADGAKTERLRVDVAGYRERRTAALQDFARKIAADVAESGNEKVLEPMGPADRKIVHDALNDMDGVETGSEGEEPRRRVVIRPA